MARRFLDSRSIEFVISKRVLDRLNKLDPSSSAAAHINRTITRISVLLESEVKKNILKKQPPKRVFPPHAGKIKNLVETGGLLNSIETNIFTRKSQIIIQTGSGLPYARIHEQGGTITPKNAKALTVPLHPKFRGVRAKDVPGLFRKPKTNKLVTIQGGRMIEAYALLRSVTIPPRPYLKPAAEKVMPQAANLLLSLFRRG